MNGVPIFPSGIVKQYISPIPFGDNTDLTKFTYEQYKGSTKLIGGAICVLTPDTPPERVGIQKLKFLLNRSHFPRLLR